jgi:hypothetical protein
MLTLNFTVFKVAGAATATLANGLADSVFLTAENGFDKFNWAFEVAASAKHKAISRYFINGHLVAEVKEGGFGVVGGVPGAASVTVLLKKFLMRYPTPAVAPTTPIWGQLKVTGDVVRA